jgi:hypothetical protein
MLPARLLLFAFWQIGFMLIAAAMSSFDPWRASAAWWPLTAVLANIVCIWLLVNLLRQEGSIYRDLFRIRRDTLKQDLLILLGATLLFGPVAFLPNILVANWLFGTQQIALDLFIQPLPIWAFVTALVLFPLTMALAELPTYFGYSMPRIEAQTGRRWLAVLLPAFFLAVQHCTLPLVFDGRFLAWRLLMFLPFALLLGVILRWRPQLLPYLVIVHGLMDLATVVMIPVTG